MCMRGGYNHVGLNRQFQAKTSRHKNSNISETKLKFEDQSQRDPHLHFSGSLQKHLRKFNIVDGRHLENRYYVITLSQMVRYG